MRNDMSLMYRSRATIMVDNWLCRKMWLKIVTGIKNNISEGLIDKMNKEVTIKVHLQIPNTKLITK